LIEFEPQGDFGDGDPTADLRQSFLKLSVSIQLVLKGCSSHRSTGAIFPNSTVVSGSQSAIWFSESV
jgi:hypothetical protein